MTLYLIKRSNYRLSVRNLIGEVYNPNNELVGVIAFFRKRGAKEFIKQINKKIKYPLDCKIVKVVVNEEVLFKKEV